MLPEEDRGMATGNIQRKFGEIWRCGFPDMQANRPDKQTHSSQYIAPLQWAKQQPLLVLQQLHSVSD